MRFSLVATAITMLLGTATSPLPATGPRTVPTGATINENGHATIETAPSMPVEPAPSAGRRPANERTVYAHLAGVSEAEAAKRLAEQEDARPQFEKLLAQLRRNERDNFTDARMIHRPNWAYVFYFKRAPDATLARYTRHPHFMAAQARYSTAELEALSRPWLDRFAAERILGGSGTDATFGEVSVDLLVSEAEYRRIADRHGWGPLPEAIKPTFADTLSGEAVPPALHPLVRIFAQKDRALGATNQALLGGRILLREGCFYIVGPGQPDRLAYFPREFGLTTDGAGYLAFRTLGPDGKLIGRVGEEFNWGGPIGLPDDAPMLKELRARCGDAPVEHVGWLTSRTAFESRYGS